MLYNIFIIISILILMVLIFSSLFLLILPLKINSLLTGLISLNFENFMIQTSLHFDLEKISVYESGAKFFENLNLSNIFNQFYLIAILFLIFDIELVFVYPYVINFNFTDMNFLLLFSFFFLFLLFGFLYEFIQGSFNF